MDWLFALFKTDNIAIVILAIVVAGLIYAIRFLWTKIGLLEKHIEDKDKIIVDLTGRINFLEGQNSIAEVMANFTTMIKKMDEKIDLLHSKKLNK